MEGPLSLQNSFMIIQTQEIKSKCPKVRPPKKDISDVGTPEPA